MNPSTEVRNAVLGLYESMGTGDVNSIERLFSCESGVLAIGTDPSEWWAGHAAIVEAFNAQLQRSGTRKVEPGDLNAFAEDNVGWAADRRTMRLASGKEITIRETFLFRQEDGEWKLVQFVVIDEDAAAFDPQLVAYRLDDVKAALLKKVKEVVDYLMCHANVRTVWKLAPFNEAIPPHLDVGGFAAGKFSPLTLSEVSPSSPDQAGTTDPGGPTKPDDKIAIYPAAFRMNGMDVGADVAAVVTRLAAMNMTDPQIKSIWIEIMSRLLGETIAHEIHHALLGNWPGFVGGHNPPAPDPKKALIPFDLLNRGNERGWLQRTGIEILKMADFPKPGSYRDGGIYAISSLQAGNQTKVDTVFPVPPAFL